MKSKITYIKIIFLFPALFLSLSLFCQINKNNTNNSLWKKVKFSGGLNTMSQFYNVQGINPRTSPFSWVIAGNARLSIGKLKIPLRFTFRDQKFNYGGPKFNKFGISPKYKWVKLLLGYRSMRFSKYSLNGKTFFGAGIELKPGKFRFSAFKGKLKNPLAQQDTLVFGAIAIPTYNRDAFGIKLGVGSNRNHFDISYLKVNDNIDSSVDTIVRNPNLRPVENLVLGTDWRFTLFKRLTFTGSANASAYSENKSLPGIESDDKLFLFVNKLYKINASSKFSFAGDLALNLSLKNINFGVQYRRIEPNYRSLGISFIQADIQSYTANANISFLDKKVQLNVQGGLESNNLRKLDYFTRKRFIHSYRVNIMPTQGLGIIAHFANYQYESTDGLIAINDTLRQVNISRIAGFSANYNHKGDNKTFGTFINYQRQIVKDQSPVFNLGNDILNNNLSIGGIIKWNKSGLSLKPSIIYSNFSFADRKQVRYGFGLNAKKYFIDNKFSISVNSQYSINNTDGLRNGFVFSNRFSVKYKISKSQSIKLRLGYIKKSALIGKSFSEIKSVLQYSYKF